MAIQTAKLFPEDIEKAFRNHLPKECVDLLIQLALQQHDCEKAVNEAVTIVKQMLQVVTINTQQHMQMRKDLSKFEKKYDGSQLMNTEDI